jgi:hypothetical protein
MTTPTPTPTSFRMLSADEKHAEIKRLYYETTRQTIQQDLAKALDLLKSMTSEEERERAAVYMDGLAQMRSEWGLAETNKKVRRKKAVGKTQKASGKRQDPDRRPRAK